MDKVIRRPRAGDLHLAVPQGCASGGEFVLVALYALAIDQVRYIQDHLAAFCEPATHFFIQRGKQAVHLEAYCPRPCLALPLPHGTLAKIGQVFPADTLDRQMLGDLAGAAIVHEDLEVHFRLTPQFLDIGQKLALVGTYGFTKALIIGKYRAKPKRKNRRVLKTIGDNPGMIHARFLVELFSWVVFADDDSEVAGGVKENLVAAYAED
jgi:hypothetical protein